MKFDEARKVMTNKNKIEMSTKYRFRKLTGSELLSTISENKGESWELVIKTCGYGDCRNQIRDKKTRKWIKYVQPVPQYYQYREFYCAYVFACWSEIQKSSKSFNPREIYEGEEVKAKGSWGVEVCKYFTEALAKQESSYLTPSFWGAPHGRSALIAIMLGGVKISHDGSYIRFRDKRLKDVLISHGLSGAQLDFLNEVGMEITHEKIINEKLHWKEAFQFKFPEVPNAILGEELVKKHNELQSRQVSKNEIAIQCGFTQNSGKKKKPFFEAMNFAMRCSTSEKQIFFLQSGDLYVEGRELQSRGDVSSLLVIANTTKNNNPEKEIELPNWVLELEEEEDELADDSINQAISQGKDKTSQMHHNQTNKIRGLELRNKALLLHSENTTETSICIKCGYETDRIGTFRRAFAKATKVKLAPLSRMIREYQQSKSSLNIHGLLMTEEKVFTETKSRLRKRAQNFREISLSYHGSKCAVCRINHKHLLEAAHIVPVAMGGIDSPYNGLILCCNHHRAFDTHLFCINAKDGLIKCKDIIKKEDLHIEEESIKSNVSKQALAIREEIYGEAISNQSI